LQTSLGTPPATDSSNVSVTLSTNGAQWERTSRPPDKVEIVPKSILSTSKNGHASSASAVKSEQSKAGGGQGSADRRSTASVPKAANDGSSESERLAAGMAPEGGTTLADLKRQRAQARKSSATPTTPGVVALANGAAATPISGGETKQRFMSSNEVIGSDNNNRNCCVII
jgi:hypothetical protein